MNSTTLIFALLYLPLWKADEREKRPPTCWPHQPGDWNSIWVSHLGRGPSTAAFLGLLSGSWITSGAAEAQQVLMGCQYHTR